MGHPLELIPFTVTDKSKSQTLVSDNKHNPIWLVTAMQTDESRLDQESPGLKWHVLAFS
jgi:hypothetical protein